MMASVGFKIVGVSRSSKRTSRGPYRTVPSMIYLLSNSSSPCGVSAIDNKRVTDHEACTGATQPKNGSGDLLGPTKSSNRHISQDVFHGVWFLCQHIGNHWRIDGPWAHRIDADSSGGIFECSALSQADHSMLRCMVGCSTCDADQTANRRVVDDGAASLLAHLT